MVKTEDELLKSIQETDAFFCRMVDLVHPDHYGFDDEIKEELRNRKHELVDKKLTNFERKRLREHGRHLLGRLDVNRCRTVTEIWAWQADRQKHHGTHRNRKFNVFPTNPKNDPDAALENGQQNIDSRDEVAEKLKTKINTMREQRKADTRIFKRRKKEDGKTSNKRPKVDLSDKEGAKSESKDTGVAEKKSQVAGTKDQQPVTNSEGRVVYSKFDFSVLGVKSKAAGETSKKKKRRDKLKLSGKDYKKLLQTVEKRDEMIEHLKQENPEKARSIENQHHWDAAMNRAQGVKVKDDKSLLKKNLKRKEKRKKMSEKQWASRDEQVRQKMDKKQADRKENLQKRKDEKKKKKLDSARKKGRLV